MITFFRKIREKLISENQVSKYLLYATGEIVLVVFGILIALQINNWNEKRKTDQTEIEYLIRLRSDLANDTAYYKRRIKYSRKVIEDHKKVVSFSYAHINSPREFADVLGSLEFSAEALSIRNNTYNEMHNAGLINIIRNEKIKNELLDFYRQVDLVTKHFEEVNATSIDFLEAFAIKSKFLSHLWGYKRHDFSPFTPESLDDSTDWVWINDPDSEAFKSFQNTLGFYSMKQNMFKGYFENLHQMATILLAELENELRNRQVEIPKLEIQPVFVLE